GRGSPPGGGPGRRFPRARQAARAATVAAKPAVFVARVVNAVVLNRRFAAAALRTAPDVVHAHDLNTLHPATVVARRCGARLVYDAHELAVHRNGMGPLRRAWARAHERSGLRAVDAMITTTDAWADYLAGVYRIPRPVVVRNVPEPLSVERNDDLRTELDIRDDRRILLYQGSIQPNRGIEQIIDALALLPECVLVVVGYGAHRPVLERAVADRGLTDRVRFFGPVPNDLLLHYTAGVDVGMCCIRNSSLSYYWSLPNKLFEYMMAGVPCVASDFPEMGGIVRTEDVGEVCDPDDPASIAAAVARIVRDRDHASHCRANARAATARHHWRLEEQQLLAAYDHLLH
ncbi:MAG: glycosyltransferase, partial [Chloroflexi bacterium]|nr:glycosyltransferase [Chloroflexota bacterium]